MNELQKVFTYGETSVRTVVKDEVVWFVAKDVCDVLEIKNPSDALKRLDEDERARFNLGRQGEANIVNESGVYELIFASRKPEAKSFKKWIKQEVLPAIRKHGAYMTDNTLEKALTSPDFLIQLATNLKEEQEARKRAESQLEHQKPKVLFAEAVEVSQSSILVGELSKVLRQNGVKIGQNRLFDWLRDNGYLIKRKGENYNLPTQYSMDLGLFEIKKRIINNPDGSSRTTTTPKVTGKGQIYFVNKFLNKENTKEA
ncbi:MAG: phage antirepressor [Bacillus sp. (in: firmicutes)]